MKKTKARPGMAKPQTLLWKAGFWATVWWAVSGLYVVLVIWLAKDFFIEMNPDSVLNLHDWQQAVSLATGHNTYLSILFYMLIAGWVAIGGAWVAALRREHISFKAGLKDLFLTLR